MQQTTTAPAPQKQSLFARAASIFKKDEARLGDGNDDTDIDLDDEQDEDEEEQEEETMTPSAVAEYLRQNAQMGKPERRGCGCGG